ncbi:MAG TPA: sugar phosphate nucleotidyltransferase [Syntrophorhabdaceae bacterium]|nr:sugar phosphate nucleotidyltransferase [Syntrophorhabdaceae bacterium]
MKGPGIPTPNPMAKKRFRTAFILGAGLGTRLRPLTEHVPKPLLPLNGRPMITYAMDHLIGAGIERFIVNTHHRPGVYSEIFPDARWRGIPIIFRHEPTLLDTAGGLKNIGDLLTGDEAILCYNGDILSDMPLAGLMAAHEKDRPDATLLLRSEGPLRNVDIDSSGAICDMRHVLGRPGAEQCLFTGIYAVETALLAHMEPGRIESVVDVFLRRIAARPGSIRGIVVDEGAWHDIGSVEVYRKMDAQMKESKGIENDGT